MRTVASGTTATGNIALQHELDQVRPVVFEHGGDRLGGLRRLAFPLLAPVPTPTETSGLRLQSHTVLGTRLIHGDGQIRVRVCYDTTYF